MSGRGPGASVEAFAYATQGLRKKKKDEPGPPVTQGEAGWGGAHGSGHPYYGLNTTAPTHTYMHAHFRTDTSHTCNAYQKFLLGCEQPGLLARGRDFF